MHNLAGLVEDWEGLSPFVFYRLPGENKIHFSFLAEESSRAREHKKHFIWTSFKGEEHYFRREQSQSYSSKMALQPAINQMGISGNIPFELQEENPSTHIARVKMTLEELRQQALQKVVLSRIAEVRTNAHPLLLFWRALDRHPNALCYWFYHPDHGCWLGASPEVLVRIRNQEFETYSLAGTQKKRGDASPEWSAKEFREQAIVTDYLQLKLRETLTDLHVSGPHNAEAGQLWHLKSILRGTTKFSGSDLAKSLHPSPAICGMPADQARSLIDRIEDHDRSYYTGYFGPVSEHQTDIYVNLRCLQWHRDRLQLYIGGGITSESDPEKEWQETCDKMQTMLQLLRE
jgi:isochorismate synthase